MAGVMTFTVAGVFFLMLSLVDSLSLSLRLRYSLASLLSLLFFVSSLVSFLALPTSPIPLPSLAVSSLFLLYSLAGHLSLPPFPAVPFPATLLDLILSSSFLSQSVLLLLLYPSNPDGIEHRYFQLLAVPALVCAVATALSAAFPNARVARAAALALQGTWFLQIGVSVFTDWIAHDCQLHRQSGVDYTVKCKTHEAYHRARAIAVLQFNCHLALLLIVGTAIYAAVAARGGRRAVDTAYQPLNKELPNQGGAGVFSRFILDSDDDDEEEEEDLQPAAGVAAEMNGHKGEGLQMQMAEVSSKNDEH